MTADNFLRWPKAFSAGVAVLKCFCMNVNES